MPHLVFLFIRSVVSPIPVVGWVVLKPQNWKSNVKIFRLLWFFERILDFVKIHCREQFSKRFFGVFQQSWKSRSIHSEVFLGKGVLKIWSKFTGEHPCRNVISIKLLLICGVAGFLPNWNQIHLFLKILVWEKTLILIPSIISFCK